ncbi:Putative alpha/beta hydrolase [Klebsormidium nitens]|uniref:Putative alpha/beta hydrolase n=1 Tax=Klebsormidium nitens TaxID=105231 RepID=A0A1Y1I3G9_KLENI|nr:Putative alpha/beta hydrolase [Klebsormidium nitens]|eukprot:GAQ84502.1 Putative alpha/beta hydrolase [Klebsormidium nitens]
MNDDSNCAATALADPLLQPRASKDATPAKNQKKEDYTRNAAIVLLPHAMLKQLSSLDIFSGAQNAVAGAYAALSLSSGFFEGFGGIKSFGGWDVGIATATGISAGALAAWALAHSRGPSEVHESAPQGELISAADNEFNRFVLTRSPLIGGLRKETLAEASATRAAKVAPRSGGGLEKDVKYRRHCVRLPDGGHLALDWPAHLAIDERDGRESLVLIVPGSVAGSFDEGVKTLVRKAADSGHFPVVVNQRGFAQSPVTTPKLFDAGATGDLAHALAFLQEQRPWATFTAVAIGSGANLLVKYVEERASEALPIAAAVAVGCPFDLAASTENLTRPGNEERGEALAKERTELLRQHLPLFEGHFNDVEPAMAATSVAEFDDRFTSPANGFASREAYYGSASCGGHVPSVNTPLLFIQSATDVEAPAAAIPRAAIHSNPCTTLLLTRGAHDVSRTLGGWTADVALEWLDAVELALLKGKDPRISENADRSEKGVPTLGAGTAMQESEANLVSDNGQGDGAGSPSQQVVADVGQASGAEAQVVADVGQVSGAEAQGVADVGQASDAKANDSAPEHPDGKEEAEHLSSKSEEVPRASDKGLEVSDGRKDDSDAVSESKNRPAEVSAKGRSEASEDPDGAENGSEVASASGKASEDVDGTSGVPNGTGNVTAAGVEELEARKDQVGVDPKTSVELERAEEKGRERAEANLAKKEKGADERSADAKEKGKAVGKAAAAVEGKREPIESGTVDADEEVFLENGEAILERRKEEGGKTGRSEASGVESGRRPEGEPRAGSDSSRNGERIARTADGDAESGDGRSDVENKNGKGELKAKAAQKTDGSQDPKASESSTSGEGKAKADGSKKEGGASGAALGPDSGAAEKGPESDEAPPPPPVDEKGIATATAESFLNVADVALPGTLSEEKKKQVVAAVNNGESLASALDLAVPPDVRMKVTGAVQTFMETSKGQAGVLTKQIDMDRVSGLFSSQGGNLVSKIAGGFKGNLAPPKAPNPPAAPPKAPPAGGEKSGESKPPPPKSDGGSSSKAESAPPSNSGSNSPPKEAPAAPKSESPSGRESRAAPSGGESKAPTSGGESSPPSTTPQNEPPKSEAPRTDSKPPQAASSEPAKADAKGGDASPPPGTSKAETPPPSQNDTSPKSEAAPKGGDATPPPEASKSDSGSSTPTPPNEIPKGETAPPQPKAAEPAKDTPAPPPQSTESAPPTKGDAAQKQGGGGPENAPPPGDTAAAPPPSDAPKDAPPAPATNDGAPPPPTPAESASQAAAAVTPALNAEAPPAPGAPPAGPPSAAPPAVPLPPASLPSVGSALTTLDQGFDDGTQRAVHNVFGVLEGVFDTLEAASSSKEAEAKPETESENGVASKTGAESVTGKGPAAENGAQGSGGEGNGLVDKGAESAAKSSAGAGLSGTPGHERNGTGVETATVTATQVRTDRGGAPPSVENEVSAQATKAVSQPENEVPSANGRASGNGAASSNGRAPENGRMGVTVSSTSRTVSDAQNGRSDGSEARGSVNGRASQGGEGSVQTTEQVQRAVVIERDESGEPTGRRAAVATHQETTVSDVPAESSSEGASGEKERIEETRQRLQKGYETGKHSSADGATDSLENGKVQDPNAHPTAFDNKSSQHAPTESPSEGSGSKDESNSKGGVLQAVVSAPPIAAVTGAVASVGSTAAAVANGLPEHRKLEIADVVLTSLKLEIGRRVGQSGFDALTRVNWEAEAGRVAQAVAEAVGGGGAMEGLAEPPGPNGRGEGSPGTAATGQVAPGMQMPGGLDVGAIMKAIGSVVGTGGLFGGLLPMGVLVGIVVAAIGTVYHVVQDKKKEAEEKQKAEDAAKLEAADHMELLPLETEDDIAMGLGTKWDEEPEGETGVAEIEPELAQESTPAPPRKGLSSEQTATIIGAGGVVAATAAAVASQATGITAADLPRAINPTPPEGQNPPQGGGGLSDTVGHLATQAVAVVGDAFGGRGGAGGVFRVAGKLALFWGGVRGATRVTERLLGFLKIDNKNLAKRIFAFAAMSVILWTPVLVPLLPTILQHRATGGKGGVAEAAAAAGLYLAVLMLIHIWGRVVRGFKRPFTSYGLRMFNRKSAGQLITGQLAGAFLVAAFYGLQLRLGHVTWLGGATQKPAANVAAGVLREFGKVHLVLHAWMVGVTVSLVEELIFRSWIHEEAAVDVGPHGAALLSATLFALAHWSRAAAPGLFLLGLVLIGARARAQGNLALPMGLHSGLIAANYVVQVGQLTAVNPRVSTWLTGGGNPLLSALGVAMTGVLAVGLYPWGKGFMKPKDIEEVAEKEEGITDEEAKRQIDEHGEEQESDLKARIDELGGQEERQIEGGGTEEKVNVADSGVRQAENGSGGQGTGHLEGEPAEQPRPVETGAAAHQVNPTAANAAANSAGDGEAGQSQRQMNGQGENGAAL